MARWLVIAVTLSLVTVGLCSKSGNEICNFTLNDTSNSLCVRMDITAKFKISYNKTDDDDKTEIAEANFTLPCNASCHGHCDEPPHDGDRKAEMNLKWGDDDENVLTFKFLANYDKENRQWYISEVVLSVNPNDSSIFTDPTYDDTNVTGTNSEDLKVKLDFKRSYTCESDTKIKFKLNEPDFSHMSGTFSNFKVQAFEFNNNSTTGEYENPYRCNGDLKGSKIVPIGVGVALAVLIIVVVVAYIIGRLRSRKQSSYEALS